MGSMFDDILDGTDSASAPSGSIFDDILNGDAPAEETPKGEVSGYGDAFVEGGKGVVRSELQFLKGGEQARDVEAEGERFESGATSTGPEAMADWNSLTPGQRQEAIDAKAAGKTAAQGLGEERDRRVKEYTDDIHKWAADPNYNPGTGFTKFTHDVVGMIPQVGSQVAMSLATGGISSAAFMGTQIAGGTFEQLENEGVEDPVVRFKAGIFNALAQAPMEQLAMGKLLNVWKPGKAAGKIVRDWAASGLGEGATELMQKYPELAANVWAKTEKEGATFGERMDLFVEGLAQATKEGLYEGAVAMVPGMGFGAVNIVANKAAYKDDTPAPAAPTADAATKPEVPANAPPQTTQPSTGKLFDALNGTPEVAATEGSTGITVTDASGLNAGATPKQQALAADEKAAAEKVERVTAQSAELRRQTQLAQQQRQIEAQMNEQKSAEEQAVAAEQQQIQAQDAAVRQQNQQFMTMLENPKTQDQAAHNHLSQMENSPDKRISVPAKILRQAHKTVTTNDASLNQVQSLIYDMDALLSNEMGPKTGALANQLKARLEERQYQLAQVEVAKETAARQKQEAPDSRERDRKDASMKDTVKRFNDRYKKEAPVDMGVQKKAPMERGKDPENINTQSIEVNSPQPSGLVEGPSVINRNGQTVGESLRDELLVEDIEKKSNSLVPKSAKDSAGAIVEETLPKGSSKTKEQIDKERKLSWKTYSNEESAKRAIRKNGLQKTHTTVPYGDRVRVVLKEDKEATKQPVKQEAKKEAPVSKSTQKVLEQAREFLKKTKKVAPVVKEAPVAQVDNTVKKASKKQVAFAKELDDIVEKEGYEGLGARDASRIESILGRDWKRKWKANTLDEAVENYKAKKGVTEADLTGAKSFDEKHADNQAAAEAAYNKVLNDPATPRMSRGSKGSTPAQQVKDAIQGLVTGAKKALKTVTVDTQDKLPAHLRKSIGDGKVEGVFDETTGKVYMVAENIESPARAVQVWLHEQVGHHGLLKLFSDFGADFDTFVDNAYEAIKKNPKILKAVRADYEQDLKGKSETEQKRIIVEEVMARRAEKLDPFRRKNIFNQFLEFMNNWLKKLTGFEDGTVDLKMKDLDLLLETAKNYVMTGEIRDWLEFKHTDQEYKDWCLELFEKNPEAVTWYENHVQTVDKVFGKDAELFNILLGLCSPQASVFTNTQWAVDTYLFLHGKVDKIGGKYPSNIKKTVERILSGDLRFSDQYKVDEFVRSLTGDTRGTTNDLWMHRAFFGPALLTKNRIEAMFASDGKKTIYDYKSKHDQLGKQDKKPGAVTLASYDPLFSIPENTAARHKVFQIAKELTDETGRKWTPREVQAAIWMNIKAQYEGLDLEGFMYDYEFSLNDYRSPEPKKLKSGKYAKNSTWKHDGKTPLEFLYEHMKPEEIGHLHEKFNLPDTLYEPVSKLEKIYLQYLKNNGVKQIDKYSTEIEDKTLIHYRSEVQEAVKGSGLEDAHASYSKNDVGARKEAHSEKHPYVAYSYWYGPDSKPEPGLASKVAHQTKIGKLRVYNGRYDALDLWAKARKQVSAAQKKGTPAHMGNVFAKLVQDEGYDGFSINREGQGDWYALFEKQPVAPAVSTTVRLSDVVEGIVDMPQEVDALSKMADEKGPALRAEIERKLKGSYPSVRVKTAQQSVARFGAEGSGATSGKMEYGLTLELEGPLNAIRAAMSEIVGLGKSQRMVFVEYDPDLVDDASGGSLGRRYKFKVPKGTTASQLQAQIDKTGIRDYNITSDGTFRYVDMFLGDWVTDEEVAQFDDLYEAVGVKGTLQKHTWYSDALGDVEHDGSDWTKAHESYRKHLANFFGEDGSQARYSEGQKAGDSYERTVESLGDQTSDAEAGSQSDGSRDSEGRNRPSVPESTEEQDGDSDGGLTDQASEEAPAHFNENQKRWFKQGQIDRDGKPRYSRPAGPETKAGAFIDDTFNVKYPEHKLSYQGIQDLSFFGDGRPDLHYFTAFDGPIVGDTFVIPTNESVDEDTVLAKIAEVQDRNGGPKAPRFSRKRSDVAKKYFGDEAKPWYRSVLDSKVGILLTQKEGRQEMLKRIKDITIAKSVDYLHPMKVIESLNRHLQDNMSAYTSLRLASTAPQIFSSFLNHGMVQFDESTNWIAFKDPENHKGGLTQALKDLGDDVHDWEQWMLVKRVKELVVRRGWDHKSVVDIFGNGHDPKTAIAELEADLKGKETPQWQKALDHFQAYNENILQFAVKAGVIDPEQMKDWASDVYMPLNRVMPEKGFTEDLNGFPMKDKIGGVKTLKDSKGLAIGEPLENLMANYYYLMGESLRNIARAKAYTTLKGTEHLVENANPMGKNVLTVRVGGKAKYFTTPDPDIYYALTGVSNNWLHDKLRKPASVVKRLKTMSITVRPAFRIANFMRDTMQTLILHGDVKRVFAALKAVPDAYKNHPDMIDFAQQGGAFNSSYEGTSDFKKVVKNATGKGNKILTLNPFESIKGLYDVWEKMGTAVENANRLALFREQVAQGKSKADAALVAKDLMDFSMHGSSAIAQTLISVVPFLNARVQGLYKLGRGYQADRAGFLKRAAIMGGLSATNALLNATLFGDGWDELEDYDRWNYWHFGPGTKWGFRIPMPFEVGAIFGALPTMGMEYFRKEAGEATKDLGKFAWHTLTQTLMFNPLELFKPVGEVYFDKNTFTGRPVVGRTLSGVEAKEQYDPWTSDAMKALGQLTGWSPKKMDHLLTGYFGGYHELGKVLFDHVAVPFIEEYPEDPALTRRDWWGVGRFMGHETARNTRYDTEFYEMMADYDEVYNTYMEYQRRDDKESMREYRKEHRSDLKAQDIGSQFRSELSEIRTRQRLIWYSKTKTPEQKRTEMDNLQKRRNRLIRKAIERMKR